jgi:hypothetical protein
VAVVFVTAFDRLLKSLNGGTVTTNREPFWQEESYDHCVRNQIEFEKIRRYRNQSSEAGLVWNPQDYPWSSAGVEMSLDAAR